MLNKILFTLKPGNMTKQYFFDIIVHFEKLVLQRTRQVLSVVIECRTRVELIVGSLPNTVNVTTFSRKQKRSEVEK